MSDYYGDKYGLDNFSKKNEKTQPKRRKRRYKKSGNKRPLIVATIVVVVLLLAITGVSVYLHKDNSFRFEKDVTVAGIDISQLSYDEAYAKIQDNAMNLIDNYQITITVDKTVKTYTKDDFVYDFQVEKALEEAKEYTLIKQGEIVGEINTSKFDLDYKVNSKSIESLVSQLAQEVDQDPVNAQVKEFKPFAENRFVFKNEENGCVLVQADLVEKLNEFFLSGDSSVSINALCNIYEPEITVEILKENIVGLSQATSISYNTANGNNNMKVALEACNGSVIEPGELWSFNDCTGDSNLEKNGYKSATVISGQKLAQGIGGGLCQASTTIFRAAIMANMSIYERHNHFWASSYAYPGEDATIDYPNLDLQLRNTTDYQMFMECKMEGNILTVNIYGYQDPSYDNILIYSKNHDIKKEQSYKTTTYRVLYLDGEIVKEEVLCNSTYSLTDDVAVKSADNGTFRTMVDGTHWTESNLPKIEEEEETQETTAKKKKKKKPTEATEPETEAPTEQPVEESTEVVETTDPLEEIL